MIQLISTVSTREITNGVGIANGEAFCLPMALSENGRVKAKNFSKPERRSKHMYLQTPARWIAGVAARTVSC